MKFFITGTDTDIGKTYCSVGLLKAFQRLGYTTLGLKPVASGAMMNDEQLVNADALALQAASSVKVPYAVINPFVFESFIAPHIAAQQKNVALSATNIADMIMTSAMNADVVLVEGAGGWFTPLNDNETFADVVRLSQLPVILVVGMRLGCLNHALLTYAAIQQAGLSVCAWIANVIDPEYLYLHENIQTLQMRLSAPCLGIVNYQQLPEEVLKVTKIIT